MEKLETSCQYLEFANRGPVAVITVPNRRNKVFIRSRIIDAIEASQYIVVAFIQGYLWLGNSDAVFTWY